METSSTYVIQWYLSSNHMLLQSQQILFICENDLQPNEIRSFKITTHLCFTHLSKSWNEWARFDMVFIYETLFSIWNCDSARLFGTSWHHYSCCSEYFTCQCSCSFRRWHTVKVPYDHSIDRRFDFAKNISLNFTNFQWPDRICTSWIPSLPSAAYPTQCW